jgi:DNA-binding CsgD family transcriptional regulator
MDDPLTLAYSLTRLGDWHVNVEQPLEALHYQLEALTLFQQAQDQHGIAQTCDRLGMTSCLGADLLQGATYCQQAIALFQQLADRQGLASSLTMLMIVGGVYENGTVVPGPIRFADALHCGEQALKIAREIGSRSAETFALLALAQCLGPRGEYAYALQVAQAGLALAEQIEHHEWMTFGHEIVGVLYFDLLALPEALQQLERALALAQEVGSWNWIRIISGFLAPTYLLQHDLTRTEAVLNAVLPPDAPSQTIGQRLVWTARAELALARGDAGLALEITERLIASAANLSNEHVIPRLWKLRGEAQVSFGRVEEGETLLQAAQATARAQGLRPLLWRICVALGKLYRVQRRQQEAEEAFSTAQALIEELAANVADEDLRASFLLQATATLPRKRPPTPGRAARQVYGGLTAREREVARLVAQGKSNREIADLLVVGNRTVEAHVSGILSKLGFTSRAQIAVWAHEKGLVSAKE